MLVLLVRLSRRPEHPLGQLAPLGPGEALLLQSGQHLHDAVPLAALAEIVRPPAVADLVVVPDPVGGEAVEHLLDAREAPVAAVDVPVPGQHRGFVRQQALALPAHPAVQEPPDVQRRHAVRVALVATGNDEIDLAGVPPQRCAEVVPHLQIAHLRALPEQAALPVGHVAGEERELERPPRVVRRGRAEPAQTVVAQQDALPVAEVQQIPVARVRSEAVKVNDGCRVGIETLDGEVLPAGAGDQGGRVIHAQGHLAEAFAHRRPLGGIRDLLLWKDQQRKPPGPSGPHPQPRAGGGSVAHDGPNLQRRVGPGSVGLEGKGVSHSRATNLAARGLAAIRLSHQSACEAAARPHHSASCVEEHCEEPLAVRKRPALPHGRTAPATRRRSPSSRGEERHKALRKGAPCESVSKPGQQ